MKDKMTELIKKFFFNLNININSIQIENHNNKFTIKLNTEESNLLISYNGIYLDALQNILKLLLLKQLGNKGKLILIINNYNKTKNDRLFDFIKKEIINLEEKGKDIKLPFFSPYERKKIHSFVHKQKNKQIYTKSIGEGKDRRIYICKKTPKLTIDIDGYDI